MRIKAIPEDFIVEELADHALAPDGEYLLLLVEKRNATTEEEAERIAQACRVPRRAVGYAGAKDKRAVTRQYMTVRTRGQVDLPGVEIVGQVSEPIGLGRLEGNRFTITVRDLAGEQLRQHAQIPNYFDEQRFSTQNAAVGLHILRGNLSEATALLAQGESQAAERIRGHLDANMSDHAGALRLLPKRTLLLYVHAYQSLLWNEVLTRYIIESDPGAEAIDGPVPILLPAAEVRNVQIPIIGFDPVPPPFQGWYDGLLARDGLTQRNFIVRQLPFLTTEGSVRWAFVELRNFDASERESDDLNEGADRQTLRFDLPPGAYATMVVKCLYRTGRLGYRGFTCSP